MKISQILTEIYSQSNSYLKRYLRDAEFDPYEYWWCVKEWVMRELGLDQFNELVGEECEEDDFDDLDQSIFFKLPKNMQRECEEWVNHELNISGHAPTYTQMNYNKQVPRASWLVHFTDDGQVISEDGFRSNHDNPNDLAGTRQFKRITPKSKEGYCFAFDSSNERDIQHQEYQGGYGTDVVMFQNSGIEARHYGDEETQIIFTASDVDPRKIIWIHKFDDEFYVMRKGSRYTDDAVFHDENLMKVIEWVKLHHQQYRNIIMK